MWQRMIALLVTLMSTASAFAADYNTSATITGTGTALDGRTFSLFVEDAGDGWYHASGSTEYSAGPGSPRYYFSAFGNPGGSSAVWSVAEWDAGANGWSADSTLLGEIEADGATFDPVGGTVGWPSGFLLPEPATVAALAMFSPLMRRSRRPS